MLRIVILTSFLFVSMFFASSCSDQRKIEFKTNTAETLAAGINFFYANVGECQEVALYEADNLAMTKKWFGLKKLDQKGMLGMLCGVAVKQIFPMLFEKLRVEFKPEYKCKFTTVETSIEKFAEVACAAIPI